MTIDLNVKLNYNDVIRDADFFMSPEYSNSIDNFCILETKKTKEEFEEQVVKSYEVYQKRKNDNQFLVFKSKVMLTHIFSFISGDKLPSVRLDKVAKMRLVCKNWKDKTEQLLELKWNQLRSEKLFKIWIDHIDTKTPLLSFIEKFKTFLDKMKFPNEVGSATFANSPICFNTLWKLIADRDLLKIWNAVIAQGFPQDTTFVSVVGGRRITMRPSEMNAVEVREQLKMERTQNLLNEIKTLKLHSLGLNFVSPEIIVHLKNLEGLVLWNNEIINDNAKFFQINNLKTLDLGANSLTRLPAEIGNLSELENLILSLNRIEYIPPEIAKLKKLKLLSLLSNPLKVVPKFSYTINEFVIVRTTPSFNPASSFVKKQIQELQFAAKSSWALLYQAILSNKDDQFESMAGKLLTDKEEYELLCQMMLECDGINPKKRNREGDSKDEVNKGGLPKVGPCVFDLAVKRIIVEKYENLDLVRKEKVEQLIYKLTETPIPTRPFMRSHFALWNLPRLADALAEEAESNTK